MRRILLKYALKENKHNFFYNIREHKKSNSLLLGYVRDAQNQGLVSHQQRHRSLPLLRDTCGTVFNIVERTIVTLFYLGIVQISLIDKSFSLRTQLYYIRISREYTYSLSGKTFVFIQDERAAAFVSVPGGTHTSKKGFFSVSRNGLLPKKCVKLSSEKNR